MTTIVTINATDQITNSRADLNTNFANLNSDKIETSYLDTDTTLAANSDTKIPTQKAVKAYVDSGGNVNASETTRGIVEEATDAEVTAGTATGSTGAKLFVSAAKLKTNIDTRVAAFTYLSVIKSGSLSKDISSASDSTITHGLGKTPIFIRLHCNFSDGSYISICESVYSDSTQSSSSTSLTAGSVNSFTIRKDTSNYTNVTISAVSSTTITLSFNKSNSPTGTAIILWEAIA